MTELEMIKDIMGHVEIMNAEQNIQAIEIAKMTVRLDTIEKLMWLVIGATVASVIGIIFNIFSQRAHYNELKNRR